MTTEPKISDLVLGWNVTPELEPEYWLTPGVKAGGHSPSHLFTVPADSMATHTAIIAQSGSGKSFFLGRLIEEIIIASKARVLILDPNSDFKKIAQVADADLWTNAEYDRSKKRGKLPHEKTRHEFANPWSNIPIRVRTGSSTEPGDELLNISWLSVSTEFLAENVADEMLHSQLYNCHSFVRSLGALLLIKYKATGVAPDVIEEAERIFTLIKNYGANKADLREILETKYYGPIQILSGMAPTGGKVYFGNEGLSVSIVESMSELFVNACLTIADYVTPEIQRFYFGKAREYQNAGILKTTIDDDTENDCETVKRIEVVDLPSLSDRNTRLLALSAVLTTEWDRARSAWAHALKGLAKEDKRVPTFIVIDEAHNLIPETARNKADAALREQFRTVAAEGRKFGLFLILVSQRPDKLDSLVLSECQNVAIMKLGSKAVIDTTKRMLGLADDADQCLMFGTGLTLFVGPWSRGRLRVAFSAARRTTEGGRDLQAEHWATPVVESHEKMTK